MLLAHQGAVCRASAVLAPLYDDLEAYPAGMAARVCLLYLDVLSACGQPSQAEGVPRMPFVETITWDLGQLSVSLLLLLLLPASSEGTA